MEEAGTRAASPVTPRELPPAARRLARRRVHDGVERTQAQEIDDALAELETESGLEWSNGDGVWPGLDDGDDGEERSGSDADPSVPAVEVAVRRLRETASSFPPGFVTETQLERLVEVVRARGAAFAYDINERPILGVPLVDVELVEGAVPARVRYHHPAGPKRDAIIAETDRLVAMGVWRPAPGALWRSPLMAIAKRGKPGEWRVVSSGKGIDKVSRSIGSDVVDVRALVEAVGRHRYRGHWDLRKAFWQLGITEAASWVFAVDTPRGPMRPTRLPMGWKNSPAYLALTLERVFAGVADLAVYVDDVAPHGATFEEYLATVTQMLDRAVAHNVVFSPEADLLVAEFTFAGVRFEKDGYRRDPGSFGSAKAKVFATAADVASFVGFVGYFAGSVRRLAELLAPMHALLNAAKREVGASRRALGRVPLERLGWTAAHDELRAQIWRELEEAASLAYPDPAQRVMVVTDASERASAGVVLQVADEEWAKPPHERRGQLLYVYSHEFSTTERKWTTTERELQPLHAVVERAGIVLAGRPVHAYTDHANLVYLLNDPDVLHKAQSSARVQRRIFELGAVPLTVTYVPGVHNAVADYLSRGGDTDLDALIEAAWDAVPSGLGAVADAVVGAVVVVDDPPSLTREVRGFLVADGEELAFPDEARLAAASEDATAVAEAAGAGFSRAADGVWRRESDAAVYVPRSLRADVLRTAHVSLAGHRGRVATTRSMAPYTWPDVGGDVAAALATCVVCARVAPGAVERPLGDVPHASRVGGLLHADYMDLDKDGAGRAKVLVLEDDLSGHLWVWPCATADAATTTRCLREWITREGLLPGGFVSDQGSHFEGAFDAVLRELGVPRHRHAAYTPSANGTVERANRELLRGLRAALATRRWPLSRWSDVLDLVVMHINHAPRERLGGRSPHEVFTGRPGLTAGDVTRIHEAWAGAPGAPVEMRARADEARREFAARETNVAALKSARRASVHARHARGAAPITWAVGDLVLVSTVEGRPRGTSKLGPRWQGPARVRRAINTHVFEVEYLGSSRKERVHARRLKPFAADVDPDDEVLGADADASLQDRFVVETIKDVAYRGSRKQLHFLVGWEGYSAADDTWEPATRLFEDVPELVTAFLARRDLAARQRALVPKVWRVVEAAARRRERRADRAAVPVSTTD